MLITRVNCSMHHEEARTRFISDADTWGALDNALWIKIGDAEEDSTEAYFSASYIFS